MFLTYHSARVTLFFNQNMCGRQFFIQESSHEKQLFGIRMGNAESEVVDA